MTGPIAFSHPLFTGVEPPVLPDRDEARRWAAEELSKSKYPDAAPGWLDQLWRDFLEWLNSLGSDGAGSGAAVSLIIAIAVAVILIAVVLVRPRLNARRKGATADLYGKEAVVDSATYRQRARVAADGGNWPTAVVEQFRAIVRAAEERDILDPRAGRTADEAAFQLSQAFVTARERLSDSARIFDAVLYGDIAAERSDFEALRSLDSDLLGMAPAYAAHEGQGFAVPR
ncbi:DUF4129 domain-containing protein [Paenarthrobacter sp. S56]|uniref:DUF4129 domain-containing protein n=1 Tax=Paenarthrobacter sp. S56 TaxID=3138179 RepID=UPI0032194EE5